MKEKLQKAFNAIYTIYGVVFVISIFLLFTGHLPKGMLMNIGWSLVIIIVIAALIGLKPPTHDK